MQYIRTRCHPQGPRAQARLVASIISSGVAPLLSASFTCLKMQGMHSLLRTTARVINSLSFAVKYRALLASLQASRNFFAKAPLFFLNFTRALLIFFSSWIGSLCCSNSCYLLQHPFGLYSVHLVSQLFRFKQTPLPGPEAEDSI